MIDTIPLGGDEMIYFIQAGDDGPIKIGQSANPQSWLRKHLDCHYEELRIIQQIEGGIKQRNTIERALQEYSIRGDWYAPSPEVFGFIREIKDPESLLSG